MNLTLGYPLMLLYKMRFYKLESPVFSFRSVLLSICHTLYSRICLFPQTNPSFSIPIRSNTLLTTVSTSSSIVAGKE